MRFRWGRLLVLIALLLAGCFQQAGETFQPASSTELPQTDVEPSSTPGAIDQPAASATPPGATRFPATPTFPPITIISQPTQTLPPQATATPLVNQASEATDEATAQSFITPRSPLGPENELATPTLRFAAQNAETTPSGLTTPTAFPRGASGCTYTVESGDNLYRIALDNDTTVEDMRAANPDLTGDNPVLQPGQVLNLPACVTPGPPRPTETKVQAGTPDPLATDEPLAEDTATTTPVEGEIYRVQPGDTLYTIALRFGVTVRSIVNANNLADPDRLSIGQELIIPPQEP